MLAAVLKTTSLLTLLLSTTLGTMAQSDTSSSGRKVQFRIYSWFNEQLKADEQEDLGDLFYLKGRDYTAMNLNPAETSPLYESTLLDGKLHLFRKVTSEDKKESYLPAASYQPSTATKDLFIYLFNTKKGLKMYPVDTSKNTFPKSSFAFVNASTQDIVATINGKARPVKAQSTVYIPYTLGERETLRIVVNPAKDKNKNLTVMTVGGRQDQRVIGFFFPINQGRTHRLLIERGVDSQAHQFKKP
ncbi:hypothetical protein SAMN02745181_0034 [Rubritalea squalenifaciens DSM 18772]|uniref:DUF4397 domain-containing protein n=1 Tax=Rubritalea squalenifaciens DSM 18772 TaxID=1123071 RepID=A0A1M6ATT6_9BACT|nr:hypothetical protein [Rubritalea squalenifaciens]SHI39728.1 hypothetical protein SAMN02745181_0034 [Rubritalea squalenifaciens DSM 18772]